MKINLPFIMDLSALLSVGMSQISQVSPYKENRKEAKNGLLLG